MNRRRIDPTLFQSSRLRFSSSSLVQLLQRIRSQLCDDGEEAERHGVTKIGQKHVLDGQRNRHLVLHRLLYLDQDELDMRTLAKWTRERHISKDLWIA